MELGMLWWDNTERPLAERIRQAVEHYRAKYNRIPTIVWTHPDDLKGMSPPIIMSGCVVRSADNLTKHHLWLGIGESI